MIKAFIALNKELFQNRRIIFSMSKKEFKNQYVGSSLGFVWGVLKPLMMAGVYWFVFSFVRNDGGRSGNSDYTTLALMLPALFAWTFLSDSLLQGSSAIRDNSYLVKKVAFPISILPTIKIGVNLLHHLIFMVISILILTTQQVVFSIYTIQIVYYLFAGIVFSIAITRLFSVLVVISIDVLHLLQTIMQVLLWATPVLWDIQSVSKSLSAYPGVLTLIKLNPYAYLVEGYRDSLLSRAWFWEHPTYTLYFWAVTIIILLIGSWFYQKNRKEFADIL